ncbi:hypothetical protein M8J77_016017 [Diaphorina citri]|nr:hypothetical protein M8J77_016017 [Diaphorina citri]
MEVHGHGGGAPRMGPRIAMMFPLHHGAGVAQNGRGPWRACEATRMIQLKRAFYHLVHEINRTPTGLQRKRLKCIPLSKYWAALYKENTRQSYRQPDREQTQ